MLKYKDLLGFCFWNEVGSKDGGFLFFCNVSVLGVIYFMFYGNYIVESE